MTRISNKFGGLAFAILAMFALWTSTLTVPLASAAQASGPVSAQGPVIA